MTTTDRGERYHGGYPAPEQPQSILTPNDLALYLHRTVQETIRDPRYAAIAPWDIWRPTPLPTSDMPTAVRVGWAAIPGSSIEAPPVIMPMPGFRHTFLGNERWASDALKIMLMRAMGSYRPEDVKFWFIDYLKGDLTEFKDLGSDVLEYIDRGDEALKIGRLARLQECLLTGRPEEAGSMSTKRHVLVINGQIKLSDDAKRDLDYLTTSGNQWGSIVSVGTELTRGDPAQPDPVMRKFPGGIAGVVDAPPKRGLIRGAAAYIAGELKREQDRPITIMDIDEGPLWETSIAGGIKVVLGKEIDTGRLREANLEDLPHGLVCAPTRRGKSVFLNTLVASIAKKYHPDDVEIIFMDGAGTAAAAWASNQEGEPFLPHASILGGNLSEDPEFAMEVLLDLEATIKHRVNLTSGRGEKFADLKRAFPDMREIVVLWDEFDEILKDKQYGKDAARLVMYIVQKGAKAGVHFIGATQHVGSIETLWGTEKGVTGQMGLRVALSGGESAMDLNENENLSDQIADYTRRRAWINTNGGKGTNGGRSPSPYNAIVRVPDATFPYIQEFKRHLPQPAPGTGRRPVVYDAKQRPELERMEQYRQLVPLDSPTVKAFVGQEITIEGGPATIEFTEDYGSNLLVIGTETEGIASVFRSTAMSIAKRHQPGSASFSILCCDSRQREAAQHLASELEQTRHEVTFAADSRQVQHYWEEATEDSSDSSADSSSEVQKHYVFVYGADRLKDKQTAAVLTEAVTVGPPQGVHTIMSSSSLSSANDYALGGKGKAHELFESRVIIDAIKRDVHKLVDYGTEWDYSSRRFRALVSNDRGGAKVIRLFA